MKMRTKIFIGLVVLLMMINVATALYTPHPVTGTVYQPNGRDYAVGATVSITNSRTGEVMLDIIASSGYFENIDVANFPSGYNTNDQLLIQASWHNGRYTGLVDMRINTASNQIAPPLTLRPSFVPEAQYVTITTTTTPTTLPTTTTTIPTQIASISPVYFQDGKPIPQPEPKETVTVTTPAVIIPEKENEGFPLMDILDVTWSLPLIGKVSATLVTIIILGIWATLYMWLALPSLKKKKD